MLFTTSWDDGHSLDAKVHALLLKYGMKGTFYVCPAQAKFQDRLSDEQLRTLSKTMELGAHTMTHPTLPQISLDDARTEITDSKAWIEHLTDAPCALFCYPKGKWNADIRSLVKEAGFAGARSTELYRFRTNDPFLMPLSLHVYPFPFRPVLNRRFLDPLLQAQRETAELHIPWFAKRSWFSWAKALFDMARETKQPWFHLFGHSWEIEHYRQWNDLEKFLSYVSTFNDVTPVTNSALLRA